MGLMSARGERLGRVGSFIERARLPVYLSFAVPFVLGLFHVGSASQWRGDLTLLRGLARVGISGQGTLSALLVQVTELVPLGGATFRAAVAAPFALGAAGAQMYLVARRLLGADVQAPWLSVPLSIIAAFAATLGATGQREGMVAGGASVAVAVALFALLASEERLETPHAVRLGALVGALATESLVLGVVVLGALASTWPFQVKRRGRMAFIAFSGGALATALVLLLPLLVQRWAPSFLDLGRAAAGLGAGPFEPIRDRGGMAAWAGEMGPVAAALAAIGCGVGLLRARLRRHAAPLLTVVVLDRLFAMREGKTWSAEQLAPAHLLAISALALGAALAVQAVATFFRDARLRMARGAAIFLVMFDLALVVAGAEEASFAQDRSAMRGAEAYTDEALERLPSGAAVLARSMPLTVRLWAARIAEGARPDVLVVPTRILGEGRIALRLLGDEPEVQGLLRDVSMEGHPLEHALTALADARPLEVELDPGWDRRIVSHLVSQHFWFRFAPEPLGPSDRKAAFARVRPQIELVLQASHSDDGGDPLTSAVLAAKLKEHVTVATLLGDRDELPWLAEELQKVGDRSR
jgi:hypothetical protein